MCNGNRGQGVFWNKVGVISIVLLQQYNSLFTTLVIVCCLINFINNLHEVYKHLICVFNFYLFSVLMLIQLALAVLTKVIYCFFLLHNSVCIVKVGYLLDYIQVQVVVGLFDRIVCSQLFNKCSIKQIKVVSTSIEFHRKHQPISVQEVPQSHFIDNIYVVVMAT